MLARRPLTQRAHDDKTELSYFAFHKAAAGAVHVLKEGSLLKLWKKYGLVLKESYLYFFASSDFENAELKLVIALDATWKAIHIQLTSLTGKKNCLGIEGLTQSYLVCFSSEEERDRWVDLINGACESFGDERRRQQDIEARLRAALAAPLPTTQLNAAKERPTSTTTPASKQSDEEFDEEDEEDEDESTAASEVDSSQYTPPDNMYRLYTDDGSELELEPEHSQQQTLSAPRVPKPTATSCSASASERDRARGRSLLGTNSSSYESLDKTMSGQFTFSRPHRVTKKDGDNVEQEKLQTAGEGNSSNTNYVYALDLGEETTTSARSEDGAGSTTTSYYLDDAGVGGAGGGADAASRGEEQPTRIETYAWPQDSEERQPVRLKPSRSPKTKKKTTTADEAELLSDWNSRFQDLVEQMRRFNNNTSRQFRQRVNSQLLAIAQDFMCSVKHYGKIIISEIHLPQHVKTIKPASDVGGVAGGVKYIVHNILFKFAVDYKGIYGSDYAAAKVAGHELKGAACYFNLNMDFCIPFMATLDYRGHRLLAVALVPINDGTLVSGTGDGGQTVRNSDDHLNGLLKEAAGALNLSEHVCGKEAKRLYSVADLEGHLGLDRRYYLIDLARVMPPEFPMDRRVKQGHLFRLLRPEFVRSHHKPLCPDACSGFILHDPKRAEHNREVKQATKVLYSGVIPSVAALLTEESALSEGGGLEAFLHSYGVNLRMMGAVRAELHKIIASIEATLGTVNLAGGTEVTAGESPLQQKKSSRGDRRDKPKDSAAPGGSEPPGLMPGGVDEETERKRRRAKDADVLLLIEMLSRVMKEKILRSLRAKSKALKVPLEEPYRLQVVRNLNRFFGVTTESSARWWATKAKRALATKFGPGALHPREAAADGSLARYLLLNPLGGGDQNANFQLLFGKLRKYTGLVLRQGFMLEIGDRDDSPNPFQLFDLVELGERVKYMNVIATAEAYLYHAASEGTTGIKRRQFLELAAEKYMVAISANPQSVEALRMMANTCAALVEETPEKERKVELMKKAKKYYQWSLSIFPKDPQTLYALGQLQRQMGNRQAGAELFLRALEVDPNYNYCLRSYAKLLYAGNENVELAELLYARARQCQLDRGEPAHKKRPIAKV